MSGKGITDGVVLLGHVTGKALRLCQYNDGSFYRRVGGLQGLTHLLTMNDKEVRMTHPGIGIKTCEVIKTVKRLVLEAVAENARERLKDMEQQNMETRAEERES